MNNAFIFDLDNTLVSSDALIEYRGGRNVNVRSAEYENALRQALNNRARATIDERFLLDLRAAYPQAKFCVFTTAPRFYTEIVLAYFYPNFNWEAVVAYEDVARTKPYPDGINAALQQAGADNDWPRSSIVMIGDNENDILAAYRSGIRSILFMGAWGDRLHHRAMNLLPDASVKTTATLRAAIDDRVSRLPLLELLVDGQQPGAVVRAPKIGHFANFDVGPNGQAPLFHVVTLGRLFSQHQSLNQRREWHTLTAQILANKETGEFPVEWISALRETVRREIENRQQGISAITRERFLFTCIPRKHGRPDRMERLVAGLEASHDHTSISRSDIAFDSQVLEYGPGALSHHGEHLNAKERFENVRDNLVVANGVDVRGKIAFVLDDVMTSGATLYVARKYLLAAGAKDVVAIALAQAISD